MPWKQATTQILGVLGHRSAQKLVRGREALGLWRQLRLGLWGLAFGDAMAETVCVRCRSPAYLREHSGIETPRRALCKRRERSFCFRTVSRLYGSLFMFVFVLSLRGVVSVLTWRRRCPGSSSISVGSGLSQDNFTSL